MRPPEVVTTILGSGTCTPTKARGPSGIVVQFDEQSILLDSGSGALTKLTQVGVDFRTLSALHYTHTHPDHVLDVVSILQALKVSPPKYHREPLHILGPKGFTSFMTKLADVFGAWLIEQEFGLKIHELQRDTITFPEYRVQTMPMKHSKEAIGYRIEIEESFIITYSGDTDYCMEIIELAKNSDLLILECSAPDENKVEGHLTPTEAAKIAAEADADHLVLTHFYPEMENIDVAGICRRTYNGQITCASDFTQIKMGADGTSLNVQRQI